MSNPDQPVPSVRIPKPLPDGVGQATVGVRGGLLRSNFEETSEALYLTSGYVYETAGDAEKAFTGEIDRYVYSRYGNPTISMFEERLRLIEGAPAAFATRDRNGRGLHRTRRAAGCGGPTRGRAQPIRLVFRGL